MSAALEALRAGGFLSALDEHFARAMGRISGEARPEVLLAAALASRQVGNGHVCLELARLVETPVLVDDAGVPVEGCAWPALDPWLEALRSSPLVDCAAAAPAVLAPLVLDGAGRLYLRRYWEHQARLAAAIGARAVQVDSAADAPRLRRCLDRLFPAEPGSAEPDWQRIAALTAARRRLCVISGGPGTGKTFTVVKLLALLVELALEANRPPPRITLVAPTGKAAARMVESIRHAKGDLPCSDRVREAIPDEAATIHRCLGSVGGSETRFRHHAENPLATDVVLVDEASMVDLALMSRLVAALPPRARLILLGDKDQLASVEAGAVLGDICNTGAPRRYSGVAVEEIAALSGERLPHEPGAPRETGIWDCIVQLTRSYRYGSRSGIGRLARAINAGDSAAALDVLASADDVVLVEPEGEGRLGASLRNDIVRGFRPYLQAGDEAPAVKLGALEGFRVLCAHRRGRHGVETVNRQIEEALAEAGLLRPTGASYAGRPIMVTRNDYQVELFNGDVGLMLDDPQRAGGKLAWFPGPQGTLRTLSPSRLPPHQTVFAMSVHKSQGSEFDEVAVLLPDQASRVVSRELLYTAVTRARCRVTIHARREVVMQAIARPIERASGLRDLLWPE